MQGNLSSKAPISIIPAVESVCRIDANWKCVLVMSYVFNINTASLWGVRYITTQKNRSVVSTWVVMMVPEGARSKSQCHIQARPFNIDTERAGYEQSQ